MATKDPVKRRLAQQRYYEANKAKVKARARETTAKTRKAVRAWLYEYLLSHPCVDCGEDNPIILEFDHRGDDKKDFNLGDVSHKGTSLRRVRDEVAKCDVRCANCHRKKTYKEAGHTHKG